MRSKAIILIALAFPAAAPAQPVRVLDQIFLNMGKADEAAVRKEALRQTSLAVWPAFRSNPPKTPFFAVFEGQIRVNADTAMLAIFSDDGCDVQVEDVTPGKKGDAIKNPVLKRLSVGQHLPALNQSFHILQLLDRKGNKLPWRKNHNYAIQVKYSNTMHTDRRDVDGCTLFAYNGGAKIHPPGKGLALAPRWPLALTTLWTGHNLGLRWSTPKKCLSHELLLDTVGASAIWSPSPGGLPHVCSAAAQLRLPGRAEPILLSF